MSDGPQLITDVQTDVAPATDREALPEVRARLEQRDLLPEQHLVDGGYVTAGHLVDSRRDRQIDLLGPVKEDGSWQAKAGKGFAVSNFKIDWENKQAICPEGKVSGGWQEARAVYGMEIVHINFLKKDRSVRPPMSDCTKSKGQRRTITVNARPYHEALQEARARQQTPEFKKQYQARAGIEGTISQAVRVTKLRKTRYRGLIKTRLQHYATAAAINILRLGAWCLGPPCEQTPDSCNIEPKLYGYIHQHLRDSHTLFLGMECDGAPLTWLYGPLLMQRPQRGMDESRRLNGSDYEQAMKIVQIFRCREVYIYAMGQEPWLSYIMSLKYTPQSRPIVESDRLVEECRKRGIISERLYGRKEVYIE